MSRFFICQDPLCKAEHAYCHTCYKEVCEKGEANVHRSIGHEVQPGAGKHFQEANDSGARTLYAGEARELAHAARTAKKWQARLWEFLLGVSS